MNIAYIFHARFPTPKAHGHQVAQVCAALSQLGHTVTLVVPTIWTPIEESPFHYYGVPESFSLMRLKSFDATRAPLIPEFLWFFLSMWSYRRKLKRFLKEHTFDLLYTRSPSLLSTLLKRKIPVILELHRIPGIARTTFARQTKRLTRISCLTSPMRNELLSWGIDPNKLIVEGDAVDLERFNDLPSVSLARKVFGLPEDRPVVGYVGRLKTLEMEKGVKHLLEALKLLKERGKTVFAFIVGGPEKAREEYEHLANSLGLTEHDILFIGEIPSKGVPHALCACDLLAMPFPDVPHFRKNMSPLKMFEYMAVGKPIVTTDLPTIRDVLDESCAYFSQPGNPESLAEAIMEALVYPEEASEKAKKAQERVKEHTWEKRMKRILS